MLQKLIYHLGRIAQARLPGVETLTEPCWIISTNQDELGHGDDSRRGISKYKGMEGMFSWSGSGDPPYSIRLEANAHSGEWEKGVHMAKLGMNHEDLEFLLNTMKSILKNHTRHHVENGLGSARLKAG